MTHSGGNMEISPDVIIDYLFKGAVAVFLPIGGYVLKSLNASREDLANYKTDVAEKYATKTEINAGFDRLANAIENVGKNVNGRIDAITSALIRDQHN